MATGKLRNACSKRDVSFQPRRRINTTSRLIALRKIMPIPTKIRDLEGLQALLVTSDDGHQTEYVSNYDKRREYISGFSGSQGDVIITMKDAALWVEYSDQPQADDQLDCHWLLMRMAYNYVPTMAQWLKLKFPNGARIGADPKLLSADAWHSFEEELQDENPNLKLVKTNINLIDAIWVNHNETEQGKQAFTVDDIYTGKRWTEKVHETRIQLRKLNAEAIVVTALDEIAWLLNIRSRDISNTRFVKSYVLLSKTEIYLYVDLTKTPDNVTELFNTKFPGVTNSTLKIRHYEQFWSDLVTFCQTLKSILLPMNYWDNSVEVSKQVYDLVPDHLRILEISPIIYLKAIKNPVEILGMHNAHIRDGATMCKFLEYFESWFKVKYNWNEINVAREIDRLRMETDLAVNISFQSVVAFGAHGGDLHFKPSKRILDNSTIIINTGGQYCDGAIAVTRTLHFGDPTNDEKDAYTRVLMGSIQLSTLTFPQHLRMSRVDVMARAPLWDIGEDSPDKTGHPVGGKRASPIYIHYNFWKEQEPFKPGYVFSNKPGVYFPNKFGVRLENVLEVIEKPELKRPYRNSYLGFVDVTLVPYCNNLINVSMLSPQQRRWLNEYNERIRRLVGAELKRLNETDAFNWMMENTEYIPEYGHGNIIIAQPLYMLIINVVLVKFTICLLY